MVAHLVNGSPDSAGAAVRRLNGFDVVVVQHEYGIYGGPDGDEVLPILDALTVPTIVVLHTVLQDPTARQRHILLRLVAAADAVVTMTHTAKQAPGRELRRRPGAGLVIPHGAVDHGTPLPAERRPGGRPLVLTWGLLGPGKGIEWAIEAMAGLRDLQPRYLVAGRTHPKVAQRDGEAYRDGLVAACAGRGRRATSSSSTTATSTRPRWPSWSQRADVVLLPYDSREQVTSGVLIEAVAAGRPVVATGFPHAVELLADGAGLVVPQRDPAALAAALRRVLTEPGLAAGHGRAGCAEGTRAAVAGGGRPLPRARGAPSRLAWPRPRDASRAPASRIDVPAPTFAHLRALTDAGGLFEHAERATPARGTRLLRRRRRPGAGRRLPRADAPAELDDLPRAVPDLRAGGPGARRPVPQPASVDRRWTDTAGRRGLLGPRPVGSGHRRRRAVAAPARPGARRRSTRGAGCARRSRGRWRSPRSARPRCSPSRPAHAGARALLADAVARSAGRAADEPWPWPEPRLTLRQRGAGRGPPRRRAPRSTTPRSSRTACACSAGCSTGRPATGTCPSSRSAGVGPGDAGPAFDQQPIEVAALADACARAYAVDRRRALGRRGRARRGWFLGDNDSGTPMYDPVTGGGYDGLERYGRNENQGAESTLALLSTLQQARSLDVGRRADEASRATRRRSELRPPTRRGCWPGCSCPVTSSPHDGRSRARGAVADPGAARRRGRSDPEAGRVTATRRATATCRAC